MQVGAERAKKNVHATRTCSDRASVLRATRWWLGPPLCSTSGNVRIQIASPLSLSNVSFPFLPFFHQGHLVGISTDHQRETEEKRTQTRRRSRRERERKRKRSCLSVPSEEEKKKWGGGRRGRNPTKHIRHTLCSTRIN